MNALAPAPSAVAPTTAAVPGESSVAMYTAAIAATTAAAVSAIGATADELHGGGGFAVNANEQPANASNRATARTTASVPAHASYLFKRTRVSDHAPVLQPPS